MAKLKTVAWFLKRPQYYPQILQILKRRRNRKKENTRAESTSWCKANCVSQEDALKHFANTQKFIFLPSLFPKVFDEARKEADRSKVKMGGEGATSLIYNLIRNKKPKKLLETGVAYGWSSLSILLAIQDDPNATLISNDMPYVGLNNEDFVGCVVPAQFHIKWDLQRLPDIIGIPKALKKFGGKVDFIHYDSDKSYTGRKWATPVLWKALNNGGILMVDDINDNVAFKDFCDDRHLSPIIIEHGVKFVGILSK